MSGFGHHAPVAASPAPLLPDLRREVVPQPQDHAGRRQQVEQPEHEDFSFRHATVIAGSRGKGKEGGKADDGEGPSVPGNAAPETAANLAAAWSPLTNKPNFTGTNWLLVLPTTAPPVFYRLRLP